MNGLDTWHNDQRGAISMITTIIISLLLLIITTGLITVMISESRQSADSEQSIRAYYAAESGVEDAIMKLKGNHSLTQNICPGTDNLNVSGDSGSGWTCQLIKQSGQIEGKLDVPDKSKQIDLAGNGDYNSVKFEWDTTPSHNNYFVPGSLPPAATWGSNRPAAVEVTIISYPRSSNVLTTDLTTKTFVIVPGTVPGASIDTNSAPGFNPVRGSCSAALTYHCSLILDRINNGRDFMFRIRTRYTGTDYRFTFFNGNALGGGQKAVASGAATIDVTGRSGNVYRRVVYKVPYTRGVAQGLDYVIYSDTNVCKDLQIIGAGGIPSHLSGCP